MSTIKNLREAKMLIRIYRDVTLEEVKKEHYDDEGYSAEIDEIPNILTGFNHPSSCKLCKPVINSYDRVYDNPKLCIGCIYMETTGSQCFNGENKETFEAIENVETEEDIINAFQARANHIESLIKKYENREQIH